MISSASTSRLRPAPRLAGTLLPIGAALLCCGGTALAAAWRAKRLARQRRLGAAARGKRLVILGGGFAGRNVAANLARQLPAADAAAEIILVDENSYLLFTPMLTEAAGGMVDARHIVSPTHALPARVTFRQGCVEEIDLSTRRVTLRTTGHDGDEKDSHRLTLEADHLVLALGSVANYHGVPGLEEHSVSMKKLADAETVLARVFDLLARAEVEPDRAARRALLTVVVGGAGYTGVETMAAVNELLRTELERRRQRGASLDPADVTTILVDPVKRLMPELKSARLAAYAEAKLRGAGVEVRLQTKITAAGPDFVELRRQAAPAGGTAHLVGRGKAQSALVSKLAKASAIVSHDALWRSRERARCPAIPGVWAIGDCAALPRPDGKGTYATDRTERRARGYPRRREHPCQSVRRTGAGRLPIRPIGELALVGRRAGVAEVYGWPFSGLLGLGNVAGRVPRQDARLGSARAHPARLVAGRSRRRWAEPGGGQRRVQSRRGARHGPVRARTTARTHLVSPGCRFVLAYFMVQSGNVVQPRIPLCFDELPLPSSHQRGPRRD